MPSFILICPTIWPQYTNVTYRTDRQTGQWSHTIGRTFYKQSPKTKHTLNNQFSRTTWVIQYHNHTTTILWPFFRDHMGEPVPEENLLTLWCKGRLTEAHTWIIRLGATPSGLTSAHLHHPPFFTAGCPSCRPTNSVKALKATSAVRLGRRR